MCVCVCVLCVVCVCVCCVCVCVCVVCVRTELCAWVCSLRSFFVRYSRSRRFCRSSSVVDELAPGPPAAPA